LPYLLALGFFVAGVAGLPLDRRAALLLAFVAFHNLLHVASHGFARYRLPVMPVVFVIAAAAFCAWRAGTLRAPTRARRLLAGVVALVLLVSVYPSLRSAAVEPSYGLSDGEAPPAESSPR
jgi:hypothetical protein